MNIDILNLHFTREYMKAAVLVSLLSVWVLVALFFYLNRFTKRRYFTIWIAGWLFYALWLTLSIVNTDQGAPFTLMLKQWCLSTTAVFLIWGSANFLRLQPRQMLLGLFTAFLFVWSYVGAYHLEDPLQAHLPIFGLIGFASIMTGICFFRFHRKQRYIGPGLLAFGFCAWGIYLAGYPFAQDVDYLVSTAFFSSAVLQIFIAVSMLILVLEEARATSDRLESKVISTEERYRALFQQATEAIVIVDAETLGLIEWNPAAERLFGLTRRDSETTSLSRWCRFAIADAPSTPTAAEWLAFASTQQQLSLVHRDGTTRIAEVSGSPLQLQDRAAYQFFFRELTERARLEQQLRQSEKLCALGRMISGVAHELNNPLATIKGYLELTLLRKKLDGETRSDLEVVAKEANRAAVLVSDFLSFSRERPVFRESLDIALLIRTVTQSRKMEMAADNIELVLELDPLLPRISADPHQIEQVLLNLITNAIQAMKDNSSPRWIRIATRQHGNLVLVALEDSGPGIPDHLLAHIFEPFFTTKQVGLGTGLGLSIAHSIMTDHQGKIIYQPSAKGGAGFTLEFPAAESQISLPAASQTPDLNSPKPTSTTVPARILVVDDECPLAELLGELLTHLGHTVTVRNTATDALQLMESQPFDLILSDCRMPVMDGRQFYGEVRSQFPEMANRMIFLTGDLVSEQTSEFLNSIGNPHLEKPFTLANVEKLLNATLQNLALTKISPRSNRAAKPRVALQPAN